MIDLLDQPSYLKKEVPSQQLRYNPTNLENDNKYKYQRLVNMEYKMITDVINALCPSPSRIYLFNDIFILLAKDGDKEWHDDQRNMKSKYTELVSALCSCTKVAKKNTIEQKVFRAILNKGSTNDELSNFMKEYHFTFAVGKVQRIDQLINKNECENVHDIITKFMPPHS